MKKSNLGYLKTLTPAAPERNLSILKIMIDFLYALIQNNSNGFDDIFVI